MYKKAKANKKLKEFTAGLILQKLIASSKNKIDVIMIK